MHGFMQCEYKQCEYKDGFTTPLSGVDGSRLLVSLVSLGLDFPPEVKQSENLRRKLGPLDIATYERADGFCGKGKAGHYMPLRGNRYRSAICHAVNDTN